MPSRFGLLSVPTLLLACGAGGAQPKPESAETGSICQKELAPRQHELARLGVEKSAERSPSRIITHAELRLSRLKEELEATVGKRVAEARDVRIGVAGVVHYTADRGPFALSVEGEKLIVRTEVNAHAEACKGGRCYASCDPIVVARAEVPLRLDENYAFGPSRVTSSFTRGCKVRALGGFLTIDVTPTIKQRLEPELGKVERSIDQRLPKLAPPAKRLWAELQKARDLPFGACVVVQPKGIVQGPVQGNATVLSLRFGLLAQPEIRQRCGEVPPGSPLPPLAHDPSLPAEEDAEIGLVLPLAAVASDLQAAALVERAAVAAAGSDIDADLTLGGEVCGDLALRASLVWADDRSLKLASPKLAPGERERVVAASVDPEKLALAITESPRIRLPFDPQALVTVAPLLAASQSNAELDVKASVQSVRPSTAAARDADFVAFMRVTGRLDLKQK